MLSGRVLKRLLFHVWPMVLALNACATAPVQEMSDARQALQAAEAVGARIKAPKYYFKAQTYLENAESALQHRRYSKAREQAEQAKEYALKARERVLNTNH